MRGEVVASLPGPGPGYAGSSPAPATKQGGSRGAMQAPRPMVGGLSGGRLCGTFLVFAFAFFLFLKPHLQVERL